MEHFFQFARERHSIYLKRKAGLPAPWTSDPILHKYKFTNIFRELDATTKWFCDHVREPMRAHPSILLATVVFRWFNKIETGEAIFEQKIFDLGDSNKAYVPMDHLLKTGSLHLMKQSIINCRGKGPYVNGAYIIKTPDGYSKLDGVLKCIEWFLEQKHMWHHTDAETMESQDWAASWDEVANLLLNPEVNSSLEGMWKWLKKFPFLGDFMAYEIVTDLRHTDLLCDAHDILTWANPGPGAMRGLNRLHGRPLNGKGNRTRFIEEMRELLLLSQDDLCWPRLVNGLLLSSNFAIDSVEELENLNVDQSWPTWEMRDVEHALCEFDKYERARLGEGRPKGVYHK